MVLSAALAKWRRDPDPEERRGIPLRLLIALEALRLARLGPRFRMAL